MGEDTGWQPARWWLVEDADGQRKAETSDEKEARSLLREGDTLWRWYSQTRGEWRRAD
jgi:hypothetical protein